jgi:hypothetical protein
MLSACGKINKCKQLWKLKLKRNMGWFNSPDIKMYHNVLIIKLSYIGTWIERPVEQNKSSKIDINTPRNFI